MPKSPHPPLDADTAHRLSSVATALADELGEPDAGARYRLWQITRTLGEEGAQTLLQETQRIEAAGGLLIGDQSRRRTPGGVYFHLARERLQGDPAFLWIFGYGPRSKRVKAMSAPEEESALPVPSTPPFVWTERQALTDDAVQDPGGSSTMKVTLVGRPGQIIEKDDFILTSMPTMKLPDLPKGIPIPSDAPTTQILVYIALKQWRKVAVAIANPDDVLIVEGFAIYEPQIKGMAILTSTVTTKLLQQAKKQAPSSH